MTPAQQAEINAFISEVQTGSYKLWFVYVIDASKDSYRVGVYFWPVEDRGDVRRIPSLIWDNRISLNEHRQLAKRMGWQWPPDLQPDAMLVTKVTDPTKAPRESDLPVSSPENLSDDEVIKVIDVARAAAVGDDPHAANMPVRDVEVQSDGAVRVYFGWQVGPLSGSGIFVDVKRQDAGYTTSTGGVWHS